MKLVFGLLERGLPSLHRGYRTPDPSPTRTGQGLPKCALEAIDNQIGHLCLVYALCNVGQLFAEAVRTKSLALGVTDVAWANHKQWPNIRMIEIDIHFQLCIKIISRCPKSSNPINLSGNDFRARNFGTWIFIYHGGELFEDSWGGHEGWLTKAVRQTRETQVVKTCRDPESWFRARTWTFQWVQIIIHVLVTRVSRTNWNTPSSPRFVEEDSWMAMAAAFLGWQWYL